MSIDAIKTVVLSKDIYDESDGAHILVGRKGERVSPEVARKHGIIPIESAGMPVLEAKVVGPTDRQDYAPAMNKRLF
jgi:hypothetical protein